jgi:AraC-like DNA-binding protein
MENNNKAFFDQDQFNRVKEYKFPTNELLKDYVKEFMIVESQKALKLETLPSTSVSLNYLLRGTIKMKQRNNLTITLPKSFAFGIARNALNFEFSDNAILFVVKLHPGMASSLISTPISDFFEDFIPLDVFLDPKQILFLEKLFEKKRKYKHIIAIIEKFLSQEIQWLQTNELIKVALDRIIEADGDISIRNLIDELPVSRDSFEKKFRAQVGTSPKQFSNIVRFRGLFENSQKKLNLTTIALNAGYYDQSHFIKEFKSITGKRPSDFL